MNYEEFRFIFTQEVKDLGVTGAYFILCGIENRAADPELDSFKRRTVEEVCSNLTREAIEVDAVLKGFRSLHERVGKSNRKNIASPENLLKIILDSGRLPNINRLVDIYNLISIRTRLALGAHDLARIGGNVTLRLTRGNEAFWPLGSDHAKPVSSGEYAYIDDEDDVICRLEVRQVEKTKTTEDTKDCFFIVQGNSNTDPQYIKNATDELLALTSRFCGGTARMLFTPW